MTEPHEIAKDVDDLRDDLAFERRELEASIEHDYSTSIVSLEHRRPMWHFMGLWITFVAGFSYMVLGFEFYGGGYSLAKTIGVTILGYTDLAGPVTRILTPDGLFVLQTPAAAEPALDGLTTRTSRKYGSARLTLFEL